MLEYKGNEGEIMAPVTIDRAIENAVVSTNMEGFHLGEEQKELIKQITLGKVTLEEVIEQIKQKYNG